MGVCTTRHWQASARPVQELNVGPVVENVNHRSAMDLPEISGPTVRVKNPHAFAMGLRLNRGRQVFKGVEGSVRDFQQSYTRCPFGKERGLVFTFHELVIVISSEKEIT